MRICVMGNALSPHVQRWTAAFAERGHEVHLLSIRAAQVPGVTTHTVSVGVPNAAGTLVTLLSYLRLLVSAGRRIKRLKPDVVHAHYSVTHGVIAGLIRNRPRVLSVWGKDVVFSKTGVRSMFMRSLNRFALRRVDVVTSTSEFMIPYVVDLAGRDMEVKRVPFGVDTSVFTPNAPSNDILTVGFVKHLRPKYGPGDLLEAAAIALTTVGDMKLVMVGDGPLKAELVDKARHLGIAGMVEFVGAVPHARVPEVIASLDILVNPSIDDSESFGVVIAEASACAVPVIVTDVGGVGEVVVDGETGIMVPAHQPESLASAIDALAHDPAKRRRFGEAGRAFIKENYEWQTNVTQMLELLARASESR